MPPTVRGRCNRPDNLYEKFFGSFFQKRTLPCPGPTEHPIVQFKSPHWPSPCALSLSPRRARANPAQLHGPARPGPVYGVAQHAPGPRRARCESENYLRHSNRHIEAAHATAVPTGTVAGAPRCRSSPAGTPPNWPMVWAPRWRRCIRPRPRYTTWKDYTSATPSVANLIAYTNETTGSDSNAAKFFLANSTTNGATRFPPQPPIS